MTRLTRFRKRLVRTEVGQDRGDTLIEVLVTLAIVSIAVVALLGGVLATTTASATDRNLTTIDAVLKSFVETARNTIETQAPNGSSEPEFTPCALASQYQIVGAPYPDRGPVGSVITVFGTGFAGSPGATFTSTTGSSPPVTVPVTYTGDASGAMAMFTVPSGLSGTYSITPFDSTHTAASDFTVDPSATQSNSLTFQGYQLTGSNEYWTGSGWTSNQPSCSPDLNSNLQQLTYRLQEPQTDNGASDQASIVVGDFTPLPVPTLVLSCNEGPTPFGPGCGSSYSLGEKLTFTATLTGLTGLTGSITWTFPPGEGCNGPQFLSPPTQTVSCTVSPALAGTLQPAAIYSGDATHSGVAAILSSPITINHGTISVVVTNSGTPVPPSPANISFFVNVSGIVAGVAPASKLQLTLTAPNGYGSASPACSEQLPITANSPPPITCTITAPTSGSYTLTASYPPGDPNYNVITSSSTIIVQFPGVPTVTYSPPIPTVGNQLVFTATIAQPAGAQVPSGTITWTGANLPASCTSTPIPLPASPGPYSVTCTVPNATRSIYTATAAYSGDANYAPGSASNTAPIALYAATPVLTCNGCSLRHQGRTFTVTATIPQPAGAPPPTGTVTWTVSGNATSCTGGSTTSLPAAPGPYTVTCTISNDIRGNYNFTATYNANQSDPNYAPETSAVLTENVR